MVTAAICWRRRSRSEADRCVIDGANNRNLPPVLCNIALLTGSTRLIGCVRVRDAQQWCVAAALQSTRWSSRARQTIALITHARNACLGLVQLTTYAYWGTRSLTSLQSNHVMQQTNTGVLSTSKAKP